IKRSGWRSLRPTGGWVIVSISNDSSQGVIIVDVASPSWNNSASVIPHIDRFECLMRPIDSACGTVDLVGMIPVKQVALPTAWLVEAGIPFRGIRLQCCATVPH